MKKKKHISTSDETFAWKSPFAALKHVPLPSTLTNSPAVDLADKTAQKRNRGRLDIIRSTAHRGGKTVTVVTGFVGISQAEKERLAKEKQKAWSAGGPGEGGRRRI